MPVPAQWSEPSDKLGQSVGPLATLVKQVLDALAPRTGEQVEETVCEVFTQDRVQHRLVKQTIEVHNVSSKDQKLQSTGLELQVDVPKIVFQDRIQRRPSRSLTFQPCRMWRRLSLRFCPQQRGHSTSVNSTSASRPKSKLAGVRYRPVHNNIQPHNCHHNFCYSKIFCKF